jgi:hypothetical protein
VVSAVQHAVSSPLLKVRSIVRLTPEDHAEMAANYLRISLCRLPEPSWYASPTHKIILERGRNPFAPPRQSWNAVSTSSSHVTFIERSYDPDRRSRFVPSDIYWNDVDYTPDPNLVSKGVQAEWEPEDKRHAGSSCEESTDAGRDRTAEWFRRFRKTTTYSVEIPCEFVEILPLLPESVSVFRYNAVDSTVARIPSTPGGALLRCRVPGCGSTIQTTVAGLFKMHGCPHHTHSLPMYTCGHHEPALRRFKIPKWGQFARDMRKATAWTEENETRDSGSVAAKDPEIQTEICHRLVDDPPAKIAALMGKNYCVSGPNRIFADRWMYSQQHNTFVRKEPSSSPDYRFLINENDEGPHVSLVYSDEPGRAPRDIRVDTSDKQMARCARILAAGLTGANAVLMLPERTPKHERDDALETLKTAGIQLTRNEKAKFVQEMSDRYYSGEIDLPRAAAFYVMTFEDQDTRQLAEKMGMTPAALRKDLNRFLDEIRNPVEHDAEEESAKVIGKLTLAQIGEINETGGIRAIRWTGGRNVQIMDLTTLGSADDPTFHFDGDGWHPALLARASSGYNEIDVICQLARERAQYNHHVDNLPEGAVLVPDAWRTDPFAKAVAKELWSRVVVFNFGAPGWYARYYSSTHEKKYSFVTSGYIPNFPET